MAAELAQSQRAMARYLRDPAGEKPPEGVEQRRLDIYRNLIFNNIESFISGGFPVLRSLYDEREWFGLVRAFINSHRCHTPYFLEIGQEFMQFLLEEFAPRDCDPPFIAELAHYEWVELALDVSVEEAPLACEDTDVLTAVPTLSPVAWLLSYQYPVHLIGPGFRPTEEGAPSFLLVYRDRDDAVRFMELNPASARLLELLRDNGAATGAQLLLQLEREQGAAPGTFAEYGAEQLRQFATLAIIGCQGA
jgi:hypothetical protein